MYDYSGEVKIMNTKLIEKAKKYIQKLSQPQVSRARKESNQWLKCHVSSITGDVLSIGSGTDDDGEGNKYKNYFENCSSYTTSEVTSEFSCDLVLDIRNMPEIKDSSYDCIFCSGVLEHVDNYQQALKELHRILKTGKILLLGVPFRQGIHLAPHDYWRFSEYGIRYMLKDKYTILDITGIDNAVPNFPATYWVKAQKI